MNDYTYQDMMRMQSEAKKRVLEMQKRSRDAADSFNGKYKSERKETESKIEELPRVPKAISYPTELQNQSRRQEQHRKNSQALSFDIRNALHSVFGELTSDDYEKMFILSLCLLLTKEGTDESIVFALMYLLT